MAPGDGASEVSGAYHAALTEPPVSLAVRDAHGFVKTRWALMTCKGCGESCGGDMRVVFTSSDGMLPDHVRRQSIFAGDVHVCSASPSISDLGDEARANLELYLGDDPPLAQQDLAEEAFTVLLERATQRLADQGLAMELMKAAMGDLGCDIKDLYVTRPIYSAVTGQGYLGPGAGGPRHPHRDTWYGAPRSQLNWWMPLYDLDGASNLAFHTRYWEWPITNSSSSFDFSQWISEVRRSREAVRQPLSEPRALSALDLEPQVRVACPADGLMIFSSAHLYSIVPNDSLRTHFAMTWRTVSERDLVSGQGPSNVDALPRGSSIASFVRCEDLSSVPGRVLEGALRPNWTRRTPSQRGEQVPRPPVES
jgi:hypothetical protein